MLLAAPCLAGFVPSPRPMSVRCLAESSGHRSAVAAMCSDDGKSLAQIARECVASPSRRKPHSTARAHGPRGRRLGINRDTPEAKANQLEWARAQMDMQVPAATLDGASIEDREDFVTQYIASEKEKFGRELTRDEAAAEVDEWLLAQATSASTNLDKSDVGLGAVVFLAVFAAGLYFAQQ